MDEVFDRLETLAVFFNSATNGALLFAMALVSLILAAVFMAWMRKKVIQARSRRVIRQAHTRIGHQPYDAAQEEADLIDRMAADYRRIQRERDR